MFAKISASVAAVLSFFNSASSLTASEAAAKVPPAADVLATMERVADWQLANPSKRDPAGWEQGAGYTGMMALAEISPSPRFEQALLKMGAANQWQGAKRRYHADDYCVAQTYAALYFRHHDPAMLAPTIERFDFILAHPKDDNLDFDDKKNPDKLDKWSWCDALFMGPAGWVRFWKATGKKEYLDFAVTNWWKTSDYLYDKDEHLYFRDSTYFARREANGKKVFWSRGNGWVFAGLARVLQDLPVDHPARPRFEQQFREMAAKLLAVQQPDGFWRSSLLDPEEYPSKETSGTGFYCFGLFWGVNHGLLDRATYLPAAAKAWAALVSSVEPDGRLIHVQPIGADPKNFDPNWTEPFGVGAFLLAGSEAYRAPR
ncbi:MAG TPA: glycoside hydrolase family 88 protein [Opitutaceae bacterium]|nr:glycoside hydrolase family 88 protein [Opitutaceae bacterium]